MLGLGWELGLGCGMDGDRNGALIGGMYSV